MPSSSRRLFRRIAYNKWEQPESDDLERSLPKKPVPQAFELKPEEPGLSVFDADIASARQVLQHQLNTWLRNEISEDASRKKSAKNNLKKCDRSVEGMVEWGWGIVEISEEDFVRLGFHEFTEPEIDENIEGHIEVLGTIETFQEQGPSLVEASRTLEDTDCLA